MLRRDLLRTALGTAVALVAGPQLPAASPPSADPLVVTRHQGFLNQVRAHARGVLALHGCGPWVGSGSDSILTAMRRRLDRDLAHPSRAGLVDFTTVDAASREGDFARVSVLVGWEREGRWSVVDHCLWAIGAETTYVGPMTEWPAGRINWPDAGPGVARTWEGAL